MAMTRKPTLFTPRFFMMCGYSFTVFISAFQLFPTAPFHIRDLGGSTFAAGLFLGLLTYASAFSAPFNGAIADRIGHRRVLIIGSVAIAVFSIAYAFIRTPTLMLALVVPHGIFWSGLMTASGAYVTSMVPPERRAEGLGYWGLSTVLAIAVAPTLGFFVYRRGWVLLCAVMFALNVVMAAIAWSLEEVAAPPAAAERRGPLVEWRVVVVSLSVFMYSFGYGGITSFSAMYAEALNITPTALYLTVLALAILGTRPIAAPLADSFGYRRVFLPCMLVITVALVLLAIVSGPLGMTISAVLFGLGYGTAWPVYVAYMMGRVSDARRGAAYGAMIAALDTGIGTGSTSLGWMIDRYGFPAAFALAAALSACSVPYFLVTDRLIAPPKSRTQMTRTDTE